MFMAVVMFKPEGIAGAWQGLVKKRADSADVEEKPVSG